MEKDVTEEFAKVREDIKEIFELLAVLYRVKTANRDVLDKNGIGNSDALIAHTEARFKKYVDVKVVEDEKEKPKRSTRRAGKTNPGRKT